MEKQNIQTANYNISVVCEKKTGEKLFYINITPRWSKRGFAYLEINTNTGLVSVGMQGMNLQTTTYKLACGVTLQDQDSGLRVHAELWHNSSPLEAMRVDIKEADYSEGFVVSWE